MNGGRTLFAPTSALATSLQTWSALRDASGTQTDKLTDFKSALAAKKATVVCIGDSITEGTGASTQANRWINGVQRALRSKFGLFGGAEFPFIPAWSSASVPGKPVTRSGANLVQDHTYAPAGRGAKITNSDSSVTFTFTGTSFKLVYPRLSGSGILRVVIDGGAPTLLDSNTGRLGGGGSFGFAWASPALTVGAHTVTVSKDVTSAEDVWVNGLLTFNGDETNGIRFIDAGRSGQNSTWFTTSRISTWSAGIKAASYNPTTVAADLTIIGLGINDQASLTAAQFKTNVLQIITDLRAQTLTGSYLLLGHHKTNTISDSTWSPYLTALAEIAAADSEVAYLNLREHMPDAPAVLTDPTSLGLFFDGIHPSDAGHAWMASILASMLTVR